METLGDDNPTKSTQYAQDPNQLQTASGGHEIPRQADRGNAYPRLGNSAMAETVQANRGSAPVSVNVPAERSIPQAPTPAVRPAQAEAVSEDTSSYAIRLNALAERYPVVQEVRGKAIARAGDGKTVKLPLEVSRDGQQMDVLFTVSVGNTQDEQGRLREVQFGYQNAVKNSIAGASRNFAVVRDSARPSTATYLMELRADEIAAGRSEYHSTPAEGQNPDTRLFKDIPIGGQEPLRLSVPVNDRQLPADMSFNLGATPNDLVVSKHGNPNAYALLARQL